MLLSGAQGRGRLGACYAELPRITIPRTPLNRLVSVVQRPQGAIGGTRGSVVHGLRKRDQSTIATPC
jgi:hypothetical protein